MKATAHATGVGVVYLFIGFSRTSFSVGYSSTLAFFITCLMELKVPITDLHMKIQPPYKDEFKKNLLIVIITIIITILIEPWACRQARFALMTQQERIEAENPPKPTAADSIQLVNGRVTRDVFYSQYGAESWFSTRKANPIAFDKKYLNAKMDIYGEIMEINDDSGCATVLLKVDDNPFSSITCSNCTSTGKDNWKKEVLPLAAGKYIHLRGDYIAEAWSQATMKMGNCHIIYDPSKFE